ncbi:MAG TPA: helix-turn-helix transcriptional regulator [Thermoanaerobaculia bacterium]|nr:helix-turn-helix transcriptional regulator [Thermoanaerobaculia bacterium]
MQPKPRIIALLLDRAHGWGWSTERLARELGIDRTTLVQYASGRRRLTMRSFAAILRTFGDDRMVRHLALHYATVEFERKPRVEPAVPLAGNVAASEAIVRYVDRFADESIHGGRGLFVVGPAAALSESVRFIEQAFGRAAVRLCRLRADRRPSPADTQAALAAALLVVERVDFACDAVADLLAQRANLVRPIVATSMQRPDALSAPSLRRIFASMAHLVDLGPVSIPPHAGVLPAAA